MTEPAIFHGYDGTVEIDFANGLIGITRPERDEEAWLAVKPAQLLRMAHAIIRETT